MKLFSLFDVLLLIGITQGLVAAFLLFFGKEKRLSNWLLALAIISYCLLFFKIIIAFTGLAGEIPFRYFPNAFELATGPLFYLYLKSLTIKDFRLQRKDWLHFIPFIVAKSYALLIYASVYGASTIAQQDQIALSLDYTVIKEIEDWLIVISILGYLLLSYRRFIFFQSQVRNSTADSAFPTLYWIRNIFGLSVLLIIFLIVNMSLSRWTALNSYTDLHWKLYFIYIAGITYYLGFMGYRQQEPDLEKIYASDKSQEQQTVPNEESQQLAKSIIKLLEKDKIYLQPELNIQQVAQKLAVSGSNLSQVINSQFNKSFRELINEYRIKDFKQKLLVPNNTASVLSLALESGFNSEASFYRVFKRDTGMTPKRFIEQHAANQ